MSASGFETSDDGLDREQELQHVRDAMRGLRFGTVQIFLQDGVVVQIERTERHRLRRSKSKGESVK